MKLFVYRVTIVLFFLILPQVICGQEKTQAYYNTHETEILPDARVSFRRGDYDRTVELCKWHYIIVGDQAANQLRVNAERCSRLLKEMKEYQAEGKIKEAKEVAEILLTLNPDDSVAKAVSELVVAPPVTETVPVEAPADTLVQVVSEQPVRVEEQTVQEEPEQVPVKETQPDFVKPETEVASAAPEPFDEPRTRFVIKAGVSVLDLKQMSSTFAPGGSLGLYDLGGSRIGVEAGGYFCPGMSALSASLFGMDASLVLRVAKGIYPKVGAGFFSCRSTDGSGAQTKGLCGGLGVTFLMGKHFCLELGAKYYPAVKLRSAERYSTSGVSYEFPSSRQILGGGIAPMVSLGLAF